MLTISKSVIGDQITCENSPVGESESDGDVENAASKVQGMFRTIRSNLEANYGQKIPTDHPILAWMVRHVSLLMFWFEKGSDGRTPHFRVKGKEFRKKLADFGECVWYLRLKTKGKNKGAQGSKYRWAEGVWCGLRQESNEHIIGTPDGVVKARTIHGNHP